ncbi:MAG: hypothetical protein JWO48_3793 [Bryobacterales bacterium]|nr:hypothetical protein [Bryobacterales bacterium]
MPNVEARRPDEPGANEKFQTDPHWRDRLPFYEHFHGDNGAGRVNGDRGTLDLVVRIGDRLRSPA